MLDGAMKEPGGAALSSGIELGSVSLKWARRLADGRLCADVVRHEGNALDAARRLGLDRALADGGRAVVTGRATSAAFDLPYRSEVECIERALDHHAIRPDVVLALGGETFVLYTLRGGRVRNIASSSRCGAGSGEFVRQQLDRMGLSLEEGLRAAEAGRHVRLSTRCSVHCKSDATHRLNKKECEPADIARTLVEDLAEKVAALVRLADWPAGEIVLAGGLVHNVPFVRALERRLPRSRLALVEHGAALEAFGAALLAADAARDGTVRPLVTSPGLAAGVAGEVAPLGRAAGRLDFRAGAPRPRVVPGAEYVLGVDAGSTTTKAVLLAVAEGAIVASAYLRTHGNPVAAAQRCAASLRRELAGVGFEIVAAATTGSGRKIASVLLGGCLDVNEIMAHGRAAVEEAPGVDTVLEIGGQDAKFIALEGGAPVDYAMNEGCSAGTGSFLEEAVGTDLGFPVEAISEVAESSARPLSFGERCAAYINSESRCALHQGSETRDVVAGMVYSIAKNYLARVVGARRIGANVLFQGGVALNRSVGLALAALLERTIVVPRHPELMGCVGAALLARDRLRDGTLERSSYDLARIEEARVEEQSAFRCAGCDSGCEIRRISLGGGQVFPFGGACTLHERTRSPRRAAPRGVDLVAQRNAIVFEGAARSGEPGAARGTVGVPRCLTAYTYFPFYRALLAGMGYRVVLSEVSAEGVGASRAPTCHPCEIAHGAVRDLVERGVDHLFIPQVIDGPTRPEALHSYLCWNTAGIARSTGAAVSGAAERILAPTMGFSDALRGATSREMQDMARRLGVSRGTAARALRAARAAQRDATERCRDLGRAALGDPDRPVVILCGRPYVVCSDDLNQRLPAMISERGYDVVSSDMLPPREGAVHARDVWHHTHHVENAVAQALARPRTYVVLVSTFSCAPDAVMSHVLRERLGDAVFCYLEIDAHTASGGFETRVEAFLDIVDEAERRGSAHPGPGAHGATRCSGRPAEELAT